MKYLFSTIMFEVSTTISDIVYWFLHDKSVLECKIYAAGRLGTEISGLVNGKFWIQTHGYKIGSLCFKYKKSGINYSFLIFSNKKVKLSMGFPKTTFDYDKYMKETIDYFSTLLHCDISEVSIQNIAVQKEFMKLNMNKLIKYFKQEDNNLFHRIVYPDFLVQTHHCIRCYLNETNIHCSFDSHGNCQILGAKSNDDIEKLKQIIDVISMDITFTDEMD